MRVRHILVGITTCFFASGFLPVGSVNAESATVAEERAAAARDHAALAQENAHRSAHEAALAEEQAARARRKPSSARIAELTSVLS
jgi:hypothetical protein